MTKIIPIFIILLLCSCKEQPLVMRYTVDFNDSLMNQFSVKLEIDGKLKNENRIYQFPITVPSLYTTMNIGLYVSEFKAFDENGKEVPVEKKSIYQYELLSPEKVKTVTYKLYETWDVKVDSLDKWPFVGTSLEEDHVLICPNALFGYFHGTQKSEINIHLNIPDNWKIATSLDTKKKEMIADNYNILMDAPILAGDLSYRDTVLLNTKIEIFVYSKYNRINANHLFNELEGMLVATKKFLIELPTDRYTFIYHFEPNPPWLTGAMEHVSSSIYVFPEFEYSKEFMQRLAGVAIHELFHIVTPLNIRSDKMENFNYLEPNPSKHLWFYEGVVEWASFIIQLRAGMINMEDYLKVMEQKVANARNDYDTTWSLEQISLLSYTPEGQEQYNNVYDRGALVAGLLDIKLLQLSDGKSGLRELILDLMDKYNEEKPFKEDEFYNEIVSMTYPEIDTFISDYIKGTNSLLIAEYYEKIGVKYIQDNKGENQFIIEKNISNNQRKLRDVWCRNLDIEQ